MAVSGIKPKLSGLARRLVLDNLLTDQVALTAYEDALKNRTSFVAHLVEKKLLDAPAIANAASQEFGLPLFDLNALNLEHAPVALVEEKLMRQHHVLPLHKRGNRLFIAVSDLTNLQALDEIKFHTGLNTEAILVEEDKLTKVIEKALEVRANPMEGLEDTDLGDLDLEVTSGDEAPEDTGAAGDEAPIVKFVHKVLLDAINKSASDIHFEPYEKKYRVRYRIDGELGEVAAPPVALAPRIAARLKVMSRLDISERRVPQDGRMKLKISPTHAIDFRVSTCPTLFGEKVVMRILDPSSAKLGIDALGYDPDQKQLFLDAIHRPYGMVLVTGPTGSGKTVSLYTALNILNTEDRNISTAEDPVEINLPGINQVNVNPKAGLTFASALRAFLRQDPDVVMVGEIRDLETADIAVKAAQTGHMVLSTLHTNDAPSTLTRLANMGVPAFNIASAVILIIAQRLGRRLCRHCRKPMDMPRDELLKAGFAEEDLKDLVLYGPAGCDQCNHGYKGRVGIYQVMPVSEAIQRLILEGANALQIAEQAKREGVANLRESGLKKVKQGITSLEEVFNVTNE
ncbi:MAG: type IV-A pilus assembly ATPase PilB [Gammaproteobacteria bacterium]|nr:type IV-A pilus assembly ATPase PilB [Gammaproteobacteria bacterium]